MAEKPITFRDKLKHLGFHDYADYQRSKLWKSIRLRVFGLRGTVCLHCNTAPARVVHHTEYSLATLQGLTIDTLQPLCTACHDDIHGHGPDGIDKFKLVREPKQPRVVVVKRPKQRNKNRAGGFHSPGVRSKVSQTPRKLRHNAYVARQKASASPAKPKQPLPTKYCLSCLTAKETRRFTKHPQTGATICCDCLNKRRAVSM